MPREFLGDHLFESGENVEAMFEAAIPFQTYRNQ
jgi:hypothetical protein